MAVEEKARSREAIPGDDVAATFANQFYIVTGGGVTRLAFGESVLGEPENAIYRTAIVMLTQDARAFADRILELIAEYEKDEKGSRADDAKR